MSGFVSEFVASFWAYLKPLVEANLIPIIIVWALVFDGALSAAWVVWDARCRGSRRGRLWGRLVLFCSPLLVLYLLTRHKPKPLSTPFGEMRYLDADGNLTPKGAPLPNQPSPIPPARLLVPSVGSGVFPGLGQLFHGDIMRTLGIWLLMAFSVFFLGAFLLDVQQSWNLPAWLLKESQRDGVTTLNFKVPPYFLPAMLVELSLLTLWSLYDTVGMNDDKAQELVRDDPTIRHAYYQLTIDRPGEDSRRMFVERESLPIGSSPSVSKIVAEGDGILPEHAVVYLHHTGTESATLIVRCMGESATISHNGESTRQATLRPGDTLELGNMKLLFESLP